MSHDETTMRVELGSGENFTADMASVGGDATVNWSAEVYILAIHCFAAHCGRCDSLEDMVVGCCRRSEGSAAGGASKALEILPILTVITDKVVRTSSAVISLYIYNYRVYKEWNQLVQALREYVQTHEGISLGIDSRGRNTAV